MEWFAQCTTTMKEHGQHDKHGTQWLSAAHNVGDCLCMHRVGSKQKRRPGGCLQAQACDMVRQRQHKSRCYGMQDNVGGVVAEGGAGAASQHSVIPSEGCHCDGSIALVAFGRCQISSPVGVDAV